MNSPRHPISLATATIFVALVSGVALAQTPMPMPMPMPAQPQGQVMRGDVDGEIMRVVKDTKRITIKHGEIPAMDMKAMTMVYQVKDPALLDQVKVGDKVHFTMLREGGAMYVEKFGPATGGGAKIEEALPDPHAAH